MGKCGKPTPILHSDAVRPGQEESVCGQDMKSRQPARLVGTPSLQPKCLCFAAACSIKKTSKTNASLAQLKKKNPKPMPVYGFGMMWFGAGLISHADVYCVRLATKLCTPRCPAKISRYLVVMAVRRFAKSTSTVTAPPISLKSQVSTTSYVAG